MHLSLDLALNAAQAPRPSEGAELKTFSAASSIEWENPIGPNITVNLVEARPCCFEPEMGCLYIYSGEAGGAIDELLPASAVINGYRGNGAEISPFHRPAPNGFGGFEQEVCGFDEALTNFPTKDTFEWGYDNDLDVCPGNTGSPITWNQGDNLKIVKSVRRSDFTPGAAEGPIGGFLTIIITSVIPPKNAVTDASGLGPHVWYDPADLTHVTPAYGMPAGMGDPAEIITYIPAFCGETAGWDGERRRVLDCANRYGPAPQFDTSYGSQMANWWSEWVTLYTSNAISSAQRLYMQRVGLTRLAQYYALIGRGATMQSGAGQDWKDWALVSGFALELGDPAIIAAFDTALSAKFDTFQIIAEEDVGGAPEHISGQEVGQPWFEADVGYASLTPAQDTGDWWGRYKNLGWFCVAHQMASLLRFPGALAWLLARRGEEADTLKRLAAVDAWFSIEPQMNSSYPVYPYVAEAWRIACEMAGREHVASPPMQPPRTGAPYFVAGASAGEIDVDVSNIGYRSDALSNVSAERQLVEGSDVGLPTIDYELAHDDGIQFCRVASAAAMSVTLNGLPRGEGLIGRFRQTTALGTSEWSRSFHDNPPYRFTDPDQTPNYVVVPGTPTTGTLEWQVDPKTMVDRYPAAGHAIGLTEPAGTAYDAGSVTFYAGNGLLAGTAKGPFTFSHRFTLNGSEISAVQACTPILAGALIPYTKVIDADANEIEFQHPTITISNPTLAFSRIKNNATGYVKTENDVLSIGGLTNTKTGTFAMKGKILSGDGAVARQLLGIGFGTSLANHRVVVRLTNANLFLVSCYNVATGAQILGVTTTSAFPVSRGEFTLAITWDLAADGTPGNEKVKMRLDGAAETPIVSVATDDTINWTYGRPLTVGARSDGTLPVDFEADYILLSHLKATDIETFDWASATDLGVSGAGPFGAIPPLYATGPASDWNGGLANKGGGSELNRVSGTFADVA